MCGVREFALTKAIASSKKVASNSRECLSFIGITSSLKSVLTATFLIRRAHRLNYRNTNAFGVNVKLNQDQMVQDLTL